MQVLGQASQGPWLGEPRPIRSDEWMVFTPYIQIAVENGFATTNALSPYHENLRSFQALPLLDWSLLFKPYHWGFFVLPAANGYSFYFFFMAFAFVAGWSLLLRRLGISLWISLPTAFALYFSQYIQVWWTTNSGAFALAPWVAIAWLHERSRVMRVALTAYAIFAWMLSCAYPPFLYTAALAIVFLVLAFRRDAINLRSAFDASVSASIALVCFIGYFHELIDILQNTVYPGQRVSTSGGVELSRLFTQFSPTFMTRGFEPLPAFTNTNACEIAVLSSLLPLYACVLSDHHRFDKMLAKNAAPFLWLLAGASIFAGWMFLSVPPVIAKLSGLYLVPSSRALLGFGLLVNIAAAAYIALAGVRINGRRLLVLLALSVAAVAAKLVFRHPSILPFSYMDLVPVFCGLIIAGGAIWLRHPTHRASLVVSTAALANVLMFGLFNPVQTAYPFFNLDKAAITQSLQARGAYTDQHGVIIAPGNYGALINGAGLGSINHVLYYPQLDFFRGYFPSLDEAEFNKIFNRYSHVEVSDGVSPAVGAPDLIRIPWSVLTAGAVAHPSEGTSAPQGPPVELYQLPVRPEPLPDLKYGHVDRLELGGSGTLVIEGWSRTPLSGEDGIGLWTSTPLESLSLQRRPRPDVAVAIDPELAVSGFRLSGKLALDADQVEVCIVSFNGQTAVATLEFPDKSKTCFIARQDRPDEP